MRKRQRGRYRTKGRKPQGQRPGYWRERVQAHKQVLTELKQCPCGDCYNSFPSPVMEFDHVLPGKRMALAGMGNFKREAVAAEVALCEVVCCNCHRVRTKKRRKLSTNQRLLSFRAKVDALKAAPCSDCNACFDPVAMDFDHVRGEKFNGIAALWSYSWDFVLQEIAKCDLVCANCHRLRTVSRSAKAAA